MGETWGCGSASARVTALPVLTPGRAPLLALSLVGGAYGHASLCLSLGLQFRPEAPALGDNADMLTLSAFLRQMAVAPREVRLSEVGFYSAAGDTVIVMPQKGAAGGVTRVRGEEKAFRWEIDASSAEWFADQIDVLAEPSCCGHQYLEHFRSSSDIIVMASCGEYPNDLISRYAGR
jgi:hypothetical protein